MSIAFPASSPRSPRPGKASPRLAETRFGSAFRRGTGGLGRSQIFRSERYDMWHNVAIAQGLVKLFLSDRYEKDFRDNGRLRRSGRTGRRQTARPPAVVRPRRRARARRCTCSGSTATRPRRSADLTAAMGITPPSLYTAFGDKEQLFLEAIERYGKGPGGFGQRALDEEPTARGAIQRLLEEAADELTQACHPLGCMMVMATTNCSVAAEHIQNGAGQAPRARRRRHAGAHPARHRRGRAAGRHRRRRARELLRHRLPGHVDAGQGRRDAARACSAASRWRCARGRRRRPQPARKRAKASA